MDHPSADTITLASFCTGVGMLDFGVEQGLEHWLGRPARTIVCVEREAYCCEVVASRMEEECLAPAPVWTNLRTFDGRPWRGLVDFIVGGYPCQPFSQAGRRKGADDERNLWPEFKRIALEMQPFGLILENVRGHLSLGFDVVCRDLEEMGYALAAGIFSAEEVGASHRRDRLFIVAYRKGGRRRIMRQPPELGGQPQRRGEELADGDGMCGARIGREGEGGVAQRSAEMASVSLFAPGQDAFRTWGHVLVAVRPDLAPALPDPRPELPPELAAEVEPELRRVVDGLGPRLDRLRACGNGVVPLQAAFAVCSLLSDIQTGGPSCLT